MRLSRLLVHRLAASNDEKRKVAQVGDLHASVAIDLRYACSRGAGYDVGVLQKLLVGRVEQLPRI